VTDITWFQKIIYLSSHLTTVINVRKTFYIKYYKKTFLNFDFFTF